jgi:hypothetical protein
MAISYDDSGRRSSGFGGLLIVLLALVVGGCVLAAFLHNARSGVAGRLAGLIVGRPLNIVSAPMVVDRVQKLARLETVVYSLDTVVEGAETSPVLPDALAGDKILMIVNGQTVAGVDLSKIKPEDAQITETSAGRTIHLTLPASQVFSTAINEQKSRVYSRDTGLLVKADPSLESQVRQKAQAQLQEAALSDGILDAASKNAKSTVTSMLQGLGFSSVDVR